MRREKLIPQVQQQLQASSALLKFCVEHNYSSSWLENIRRCIESLEEGDIPIAVGNYTAVPLGGNGCFNDWWPPVVYEHETPEYVGSVFEALVSHWAFQMGLLKERPNPAFERDSPRSGRAPQFYVRLIQR